MRINLQSTLIIIPCYNEEESLPKLLPELEKFVPRSNILVIDDGSTDKSRQIIQEMGFHCLALVQNCGIGGTVQTGIIYALRNGFTGAIQLDGDGQHPPDQISKLIETAASESADLVIGSRFSGINSFRSSTARRFGITIIHWTLRFLFQLHVNDCTSGFRYYGQRALKIFSEQYPLDYPEPISLGMAAENSFRVSEVPVIMRERQGGTSSISGFKALKYMVRVIGYLFLVRAGQLVMNQRKTKKF